MSTFTLIKANSSDIWIHNDGTDELILSLGYFRMVDDKFELYSESGGQLRKALLSDIIVRDDSTGGGNETFSTALQLVTRLRALSYPFFPDSWGGGSGAVDSVFGRTGVVIAQAADYNASQITNDSTVFGTNVDDALEYLASINSSEWANYVGSWSGGDGVLNLGDIGGNNNGTLIVLDDANETITLNKDLVLTDKVSGFKATFNTADMDADYTYRFPANKGGTFAMTDDIVGGANTIYNTDDVLTGDRTVGLSGFRLIFSESSGVDTTAISLADEDIYIYYENSGGSDSGINITPSQMLVIDEINAIGLRYADDYSANFTERSLVDKGYVDSVASSLTLTGDVTGSGSGSIATTISNGVVSVAMMSAGGTPSATTFLRGDNTWATPSTTSVLTTDGDILYYNSGDDRLPIGSEGQFLIVSSGLPAWSTISGTLSGLTDNQVAVASGADSVDGDAYFTYDGDTLIVGGENNGTMTLNDTAGTALFNFANYVSIEANEGIRLIPQGSVNYHSITSEATSNHSALIPDKAGTFAFVGDNDRLSSATPSSGTLNVDWSDAETWDFTITEATTLSETNTPTTNETKVITLYITGDFALTFPAGWGTNQIGTYDGTKLNQIVVEYRSSGNYFTTINQPD